MGGEHYGHTGGGANYVCLPHNPKYDKYQDGHQTAGYIYGTESITMKHPALSAMLSHVVQC